MKSMKITLPDGSKLEVKQGSTIKEIAEKIGAGLARAALAGEVNGELKDLNAKVEKDSKLRIITIKDKEGKEILNHSAAHVMAAAVLILFPDAKPTIGPAIEEGYYYDFYKKEPFKEEDKEKIEKEMQKIIDANLKFERKIMKKEDAIKFYKDNKFKKEIIEQDIPDKEISFYKLGEFSDLCRGPHVPSTGYIKAFKITNQSSAYWRANEKNEQLQRLYGIAFTDKKELKEYLTLREEAEKRSNMKIGKELDLFSIHEVIGPGLPLFHPKGNVLRMELRKYIREINTKLGFKEVWTPHIAKSDLWHKSGHYEGYKDKMYIFDKDGQEHAIRPMNCPFHSHIYKSNSRSYKDLPIAYSEFGTVYRYEKSGELSGLLRVRALTQDDGHMFIRPDQVEEQVAQITKAAMDVLKTLGLNELTVYLSTKPEKSIGDPKVWAIAEKTMMKALEKAKIKYEICPREGAFYGPKIEVHAKDALGRNWQLSTVQLDFFMPERFELEYTDDKGEKKTPVIIHRALLGSIERFLGVYIENCAGKFPVWISPVQTIIIPITDKQAEHARKTAKEMNEAGIRLEIDDASETLDYRIRKAQLQKVPYMIVIGEKEAKEGTINVRNREGKTKVMKINEFITYVQEKIKSKSLDL